jgi:hypothetical protein
MNNWRWSTGEAYYKSPRTIKEKTTYVQDNHIQEMNAINQSLEDNCFQNTNTTTNTSNLNNDTTDISDITKPICSRNINDFGNKREDIDIKIAGREQNIPPFLMPNNLYK